MTNDTGFLVQMALLLSPVAASEMQMLKERENLAKEVGVWSSQHDDMSIKHRS